MRCGWLYILASKRNGTLYVGVTSNLRRRLLEYREGLTGGFTARYGVKQLVYLEQHDSIAAAIKREKAIKHWPRAWKLNLIHSINPEWHDLADRLHEL